MCVSQVAEGQMKTEREKQELIEKYHKEIAELQSQHDTDRVSENAVSDIFSTLFVT
jgi:hypothetical protein